MLAGQPHRNALPKNQPALQSLMLPETRLTLLPTLHNPVGDHAQQPLLLPQENIQPCVSPQRNQKGDSAGRQMRGFHAEECQSIVRLLS
jgi:hypothetical protein